ncbi:hypothetical protein D3C87_1260980 [compost metagenome]
MKSLKTLLVPALFAIVALGGCAKKDSDFAARYATNGAGAAVKDGQTAAEAGEYAATKGLTRADIVQVTRSTNGNGATVVSQVVINNQQIQVTTQHAGTEIREGSLQVGAYYIQFHAMCANATCEPYFAAMEVYSNNQLLIQEGIRIHFANPAKSVYQLFSPALARTFYYQNMNNTGGVVGYLNTYQTTGNGAGLGL